MLPEKAAKKSRGSRKDIAWPYKREDGGTLYRAGTF